MGLISTLSGTSETDPWFGILYNVSELDSKTIGEVTKAYNTAEMVMMVLLLKLVTIVLLLKMVDVHEGGDDVDFHEGGDDMDVHEGGRIVLGDDGGRVFYVKSSSIPTLKVITYLHVERGVRSSALALCYLESLNLPLAATGEFI